MCIDLVGVHYIRKVHYFGRKLKGADLMQYLRRKKLLEKRVAFAQQAAEIIEMYMKVAAEIKQAQSVAANHAEILPPEPPSPGTIDVEEEPVQEEQLYFSRRFSVTSQTPSGPSWAASVSTSSSTGAHSAFVFSLMEMIYQKREPLVVSSMRNLECVLRPPVQRRQSCPATAFANLPPFKEPAVEVVKEPTLPDEAGTSVSESVSSLMDINELSSDSGAIGEIDEALDPKQALKNLMQYPYRSLSTELPLVVTENQCFALNGIKVKVK
ncbi:unnamed protein product [Soboliphyme baturini]|uniref:PID domain-containing protein n=1 Tax=Soboliphyme baturini TaxID=241478 RepID=A0A183J3F8_9BILA|nr:unnamed protein product [Soboliphyme baturini]